ncbi:MAG: cysteine--tRNA ligase [Candidatus Dormibacteraeota bacterium]|nr:cysteine--tRNA ligase [Candidatus Dormibacteraeota bacterium]
MTLRLFDTLTRRLQPVEPLRDQEIRMYTCGPTVYNRVHIGNFRTFLFEDVLRRWLERRFERVVHVMNLTDVDDRIINNARESGHSLDEETAPWIAAFFEDRDTLGIRPAHHYPRATEYVAQMVELIERLEREGAAYRREGSVYFHIPAFPAYGRLSGISADQLIAGASGRVDADDYTKEDVRDFALWKAVAPGQAGWDSPFGRGHPGWHIECSAMSMTLLGESFDIHCGGVDNIFPHHENEIAQSEAATHKQFVRMWVHSEHLRVDGEKMARRTGRFLRVPEVLEQGASAAALRYLLAASTHYRKPLNYSDEPLAASREAVERLVSFRDRLRELQPSGEDEDTELADDAVLTAVRQARTGFDDAMDDDLNLPEAMGAVFASLRDINRVLDGAPSGGEALHAVRSLLDEVDDVLGVFPLVDRERELAGGLDEEEESLLQQRAAARQARDFALSDRLREELARRGIDIDDTPGGQRWKRSA